MYRRMIPLPKFLLNSLRSSVNTLLVSLIIFAVGEGISYAVSKINMILKEKMSGDNYNKILSSIGSIKKIQDRLASESSFPRSIVADLTDENVDENKKIESLVSWIRSNLTDNEKKTVASWIAKNVK